MLLAAAVGWMVAVAGCGQGGTSNASPSVAGLPKVNLGSVACLATQWYPQSAHGEDETENRLLRELVRQGVLMAAREEFGLATRDETLGEPFPAATGNEAAEPLALWLEVENDGRWEARLFGGGTTRDKPVWHHQGKVDFNKRTMYAQLATQINEACPAIVEQLRAAGAAGEAIEVNPLNKPSAEIEQELAEMNFVAQFAAVRSAHEAMRENGVSLDWLGVLVRGYAHLSLLTHHTWSSHSDAFAARSLLYAERMMQLDHGSQRARTHRAYARAIIGAHGSAIDELDTVMEFEESETGVAGQSDAEMDAWLLVTEPYARFDHDQLAQIAAEHPDLKELAGLLQWNLYHSYMHGRWIHEKGQETMQACPEAYGVYSVMANWSALGIKRIGISQGMAAFAHYLPQRLAKLENLPNSVRQAIEEQENSSGNDTAHELPMACARLLRSAARDEAAPSECSWAILASLIAEEQFVEAANLLKVAGDAVEYSKSEMVDSLMPLVEDHRYAAYIRSFGVPRNQPKSANDILRTLEVIDPRMNMQPMFIKLWQVPDANGLSGAKLSWRATWAHDFTQPGLLEAWYIPSESLTGKLKPASRMRFAHNFKAVSPFSPNAVRLQWENAESNDVPRLEKLEPELKEDPVGWMTIAWQYNRLKNFDAAMRCYQRSVEISPCYEATVGLATCYSHAGDMKKWQSTLEDYLEVEDLGLAHAQIHELIAEENMRHRRWKAAEPHALFAAETYSARGLLLASGMYEGMQDWQKSEYFAATATRSYPTWSGTAWYFWCRRTGRGDQATARPIAEQSIQIATHRNYRDDAERTLIYRLLEGDPGEALAEFERHVARCSSEDKWEKVYRLMHTIAVVAETADVERTPRAVADLRAHVQQQIRESDPEWAEPIEILCRAFECQNVDDDMLGKYYAATRKGNPNWACNYCYFMGVALEQQGLTEPAELFLRRAAFAGPFHCYAATLAGDRLVKRYGPDRGGVPEEFLEQEAGAAERPDDAVPADSSI